MIDVILQDELNLVLYFVILLPHGSPSEKYKVIVVSMNLFLFWVFV